MLLAGRVRQCAPRRDERGPSYSAWPGSRACRSLGLRCWTRQPADARCSWNGRLLAGVVPHPGSQAPLFSSLACLRVWSSPRELRPGFFRPAWSERPRRGGPSPLGAWARLFGGPAFARWSLTLSAKAAPNSGRPGPGACFSASQGRGVFGAKCDAPRATTDGRRAMSMEPAPGPFTLRRGARCFRAGPAGRVSSPLGAGPALIPAGLGLQ